MARVGDEIDYLKGKKWLFRHSRQFLIRYEILSIVSYLFLDFDFLIDFALLTFAGLRFMLNNQNDKALSNYQNVISAPQEQAHITIYLP